MPNHTTPHIIEVNHLTKKYKDSNTPAVDDISFYVDPGTLFSFLGPNGAGKTTTMSILTTIRSKTAGSVTIAGYDLDKHPSQVRSNIGVIFQNPSLDRNLTAEENVRFHANLYGLYPYRPTFNLMSIAYKKKLHNIAQILGLDNDVFKPVKQLSGGMKRKLEILRGLMHNPKILFLDEPTTGLDPVSRANLWTYLQDIKNQQKTTIFLTTHYLQEAENSDYICIIDQGKIVHKGAPEEIKNNLLENTLDLTTSYRAKLRKELHSLNLKFIEDTTFKINIDHKNVQKIISQIKTPISKINIIRPTLEQAYLKIINHG